MREVLAAKPAHRPELLARPRLVKLRACGVHTYSSASIGSAFTLHLALTSCLLPAPSLVLGQVNAAAARGSGQ